MRCLRRSVDKPLGEIMIELGIISDDQRNQALAVQKKKRKKKILSGTALIELGFASEEDVLHAVNTQYSIPYLPIDNYQIDAQVTDLIPLDLARKYMVCAIEKMGNVLSVAMANPLDDNAVKEIEEACHHSVQTFIATTSEITRAINKQYNGEKEKRELLFVKLPHDIS
ncbi:hypothetical protein ACFL1K_05285 [Candidatus Omnitrophota bacterium]